MPPTSYAALPTWWNQVADTIAKFDLHVWSSASGNLTNSEVVAAMPHPFTQADTALDSVDHTADTLTKTAHGMKTGDGPRGLTTTGTAPTGLAVGTPYWIIKVDNDTVKVALSLADALAGNAVAFSSNGSGTISLVDGDGASRLWWQSYGKLPTPIVLSDVQGFTTRLDHRSAAAAYGLVGTISAGNVSASVVPITSTRET